MAVRDRLILAVIALLLLLILMSLVGVVGGHGSASVVHLHRAKP